MSRYKSLKTVCCAAVLTLGLAACGGGSDSDQAAAPDPTPPSLTAAEQLTMAQDAVTTAQAAVAAAQAPAEISAAYGQLAMAQAALAAAQSIPENVLAALRAQLEQARTDLEAAQMLASQKETLDAALAAADEAVAGLSDTSGDADVAAAQAAVMAAQEALAAATELPADDPLRASVSAVGNALTTALDSRTAAMEADRLAQMAAMQTETINGLIAVANAAVTGLDQLTSSGTEVQAARAALAAVTDAIETASALDDAEKAALGAMISMAGSDLMEIETYQASAAGMLAIAEHAVASAQLTVEGLPPTATPADIAVANAALAQAQAHLAQVSLNPQVMQILTQRRLAHLETVAAKRAVVSEVLEAAQTAVDALTDESTDAEVEAARGLVDVAKAALHDSELSEADSAGLSQSIYALDTTVGGIETARAEAAAEAYKTALAGVTSEIATAKTLADALTDESSAADVTAANNAVSTAQTALNDAGLTADDTTTQQAAITALTTTISDGEADRTAHRTMVAEAKVVSDSDAAKTKTKAITAEAGETGDNDAGLGGSGVTATGNDEGAYNLAIKRDRDGTTVTVTVEGATDDADVTFMKYTDLDGAAGHKGQMQTRSMDADDDGNVVTEVALVYTDIDAPVATAFGKVHTLDVRVDGEDATDADPDDALNVVADDLALVKASAFTAPADTVGTTILTFQRAVEDNDGTMDVDESRDAAEIMGTYEGAMGTYKCNAESGDGCTVTVNAMGVVSAVGADDWIFIPADMATVDVDDADYLRYGAWLQRTADKDGATEYNEVQTFAGSSVAATASVAEVEGSAKYEGGAAGVYVKNVFTSEGKIDTAASGHFTADAELNATFGQVEDDNNVGTIAANLLNTLTGTIDNFNLSGGENNEWSVSLQGATGNIVDAGTASGAAQGGGDAGTWNATFHGLATHDHDNDPDTNMVPTAPGSVTGEFDANFSNGSVAGGFGARKE